MDFYELGCTQAADEFGLEKIAVGMQQARRIADAAARMGGNAPAQLRDRSPAQLTALRSLSPENTGRTTDSALNSRVDFAEARLARNRSNSRDAQVLKLPTATRAAADKLMLSGRHAANPIVHSVEGAAMEGGGQSWRHDLDLGSGRGVDVERRLWRGRNIHEEAGDAHYSGSPSVAAMYADPRHAPVRQHLSAYSVAPTTKTPGYQTHQGRTADKNHPNDAEAWPYFEKTIPHGTAGIEEVARYKPLATKGKYMQVAGNTDPLGESAVPPPNKGSATAAALAHHFLSRKRDER